MKFGVYEICKPLFTALLTGSSEAKKSPAAFLLASVVAGAVASLLLCPMESTRIKIVTDPEYAGKGLMTALPKMAAEDGLLSPFSGLWAMLAKQVPYTFGKQVSFDVFAAALYAFISGQMTWMGPGEQKWAVSILSAFGASIVACIFSQPGDMILTETHRPKETPKKKIAFALKKKPVQKMDRSFGGVVSRIYKRGGLPAYFTGTGARIVHVGLIITSQLVIYDVVKQMLGLPATGSH